MAKERRSYLERELADLTRGDVVITTNWDTLVERVLFESRRWNPADGFGFPVRLEIEPEGTPLKGQIPSVSEVKILKLHGSFGWYKRHGGIYIGGNRFFGHLYLKIEQSVLFFRDATEPARDRNPEAAFVYPSFIKQLVEPELQQVWGEAASALKKCDEFRAVGYSLPGSDTGVRVLLNPLRARHDEGTMSIIVEDPDDGANKRWQALLGDDIKLTRRRLGPVEGGGNSPAER